ncbi:hypothetical protein G6F61_015168 [Rhizopus arrhizus]|nr:hypothetical protein G6F61_015168 [Rhizopus arrhizus]
MVLSPGYSGADGRRMGAARFVLLRAHLVGRRATQSRIHRQTRGFYAPGLRGRVSSARVRKKSWLSARRSTMKSMNALTRRGCSVRRR